MQSFTCSIASLVTSVSRQSGLRRPRLQPLMLEKRRVLGLIGLFALLAFTAGIPPTREASRYTKGSSSYGDLPLSFEANQGQTDSEVQFLARALGYRVFLTPSGAVLRLGLQKDTSTQNPAREAVVRMQLLGANTYPTARALEKLPGKVNYFRGSDPLKWQTNVPTYAKVEYTDVYPGVDLLYYGDGSRLEYDFVVAPGANPDRICLAFEGVDSIDVDDKGNLVLSTADRYILFAKPAVYQQDARGGRQVNGEYVRNASHEVSFRLGPYDRTRPLVIDPVLIYATYLGGSSLEEGRAIAVDSAGAAYVTGNTFSPDFPTAHPLQATFGGGSAPNPSDAFVAKFTPDGNALLYATYVGGSGNDRSNNIAVDATGHAYITGLTDSSDFPVTTHAFQPRLGGRFDRFVAKLAPDGTTLIYATYLGGNRDDGGAGIAVDAVGHVYVTGQTGSDDFPIVRPLQSIRRTMDAFVAKLAPDGASLIYSTYLGGSGVDAGNSIAVDATGQAYVTGSLSQPTSRLCIHCSPPSEAELMSFLMPSSRNSPPTALLSFLLPILEGAATMRRTVSPWIARARRT